MPSPKCAGCGLKRVAHGGAVCGGCKRAVRAAEAAVEEREMRVDGGRERGAGGEADPDAYRVPEGLKGDVTYEDLRAQAEDLREARARYRRQWYATDGRGVLVEKMLPPAMMAQLKMLSDMSTALVEAGRKWAAAMKVAEEAMTPAEVTEEAVTWLAGADVGADKKRDAVERILRSLGEEYRVTVQ